MFRESLVFAESVYTIPERLHFCRKFVHNPERFIFAEIVYSIPERLYVAGSAYSITERLHLFAKIVYSITECLHLFAKLCTVSLNVYICFKNCVQYPLTFTFFAEIMNSIT
jgi:hypothetical protein